MAEPGGIKIIIFIVSNGALPNLILNGGYVIVFKHWSPRDSLFKWFPCLDGAHFGHMHHGADFVNVMVAASLKMKVSTSGFGLVKGVWRPQVYRADGSASCKDFRFQNLTGALACELAPLL